MKITDIVNNTDHLEEGPLLNKIGTGIAKGVGTAAKAAGAVAGGIAGIGTAFKKGYAAGKGTVGAAGDDEPNTGTAKSQNTASTATSTDNAAQTTTPTPKTAAPTTTTPTATAQTKSTDTAPTTTPTPAAAAQNKTEPQTKPAATPATAAQDQKSTAADAQAKPAAVTQTGADYAQVEKAVDALGLEDQKKILSLLQSDPEVKKSMPKNRVTQKKKIVKPSQQELDADREAKMGPTSDSIIRKGRSIVEDINEAGLMAKLGSKVGQAAQAVGQAAGTAVKTAQDINADPEHAKNMVKAFATGQIDQSQSPAAKIQDASGTVPKEIIEKLNQLTLEQRDELYQLLVKKTV